MKLFRTTDDTTTDDETSHDENGDTAMSPEPTTPGDGGQYASTPLVNESESPAEPVTADQDAVTTADQPRPTFTPAPAPSADSTAVTSVQPDPADDGGDFT